MLNVPFDMSSVGCLMSRKCKVEKLKYFYLTILTVRRVVREIVINSINKLKTKHIFTPRQTECKDKYNYCKICIYIYLIFV